MCRNSSVVVENGGGGTGWQDEPSDYYPIRRDLKLHSNKMQGNRKLSTERIEPGHRCGVAY